MSQRRRATRLTNAATDSRSEDCIALRAMLLLDSAAAELRRYTARRGRVRRSDIACCFSLLLCEREHRVAILARGSLGRLWRTARQVRERTLLPHAVNWRAPSTATSSCGVAAQCVWRVGVGTGGPRDASNTTRQGRPTVLATYCAGERRAPKRRGITNAEAVADLRTAPTRFARWRIVVTRRSLAIGVIQRDGPQWNARLQDNSTRRLIEARRGSGRDRKSLVLSVPKYHFGVL
jgi:hypothetical protein